ncbi:MAG: hypothetical protein P8P74_16455 [Crocinitomicaceae bacterium]|nr:hypothetical protein [Crocinitomicaceae bacterium]
MKFGKLLLIGATALLTFGANAQGDDKERECKRMRFLAGEEGLNVENYQKATMYLLKAETICGSLDKDNWNRLIGSLRTVINGYTDQKDQDTKKAYIDTLLGAWERQEAAGFYDPAKSDLDRGTMIMQSAAPDVRKADEYFQRGITAAGLKTHESYIIYAYYATYSIYTISEGEEQVGLKKRMIDDYFRYSEMVTKAGMTPQTQETLTTYLDYVVESCEALLPEIPGYITNLPEDKEAAITSIQKMLTLLETKSCADSEEHLSLVNAWLERDPNSLEALTKKLSHMPGTKAIPIIEEIMSKTDDPALKAELQYKKAYAQYKAGQYKAAYASGRACTGEYSSKGMLIAAQSVAATANSCGDSTFERKCNYLYAAQLAEKAGQGGTAAGYKAKGPTSKDCFDQNSPSSVTLTCWGVTVNPCP